MNGDPRSIVTPDAFSVTPALLGTPLAEPWRRLVALLLDLVVVNDSGRRPRKFENTMNMNRVIM